MVQNLMTRNKTVIAGMISKSLYNIKILETLNKAISFLESKTELITYLLLTRISNVVLVLDNCSFLWSILIKELMERNRYELKILFPYCPFFNLIKKKFTVEKFG